MSSPGLSNYDAIGPKQPTTAWALKKVWPEITLHIVPDAGHSSRELGITKLLVEVRDSHHLPTRPQLMIVPLSQIVHLLSSGHGQIRRPLSDECTHDMGE